MKYQCSNCKSSIKEGDKTCPKCGEELTWKGEGRLSKLSIASLVLGILAFLFSIPHIISGLPYGWTPFLSNEYIAWNFIFLNILGFIVGIPISITAIVLGSRDLKNINLSPFSKKSKGLDITGITLGVLSIIFIISCVILYLLAESGVRIWY